MSARTPATPLASLLLLMAAAPTALAQTTLTVWMEAPAQVQAGSSFEVDVFLRGETDLFDDSPGMAGFNAAGVDQTVTALNEAVVDMSFVSGPDLVAQVFEPVFDPAGPALLGGGFFQGVNDPALSPSWQAIPELRMFTYRVDLAPDITGSMTIVPVNLNAWFTPSSETFGGGIMQDDPGVTLDLQPLTVRVVPTPATVAPGLALLVIGARRRRA
ncbi:MAG: hypothetical protein AAFP26_06265 [Planctomycetota bacterium]